MTGTAGHSGGKRRKHCPRKLDHDKAREAAGWVEKCLSRLAVARMFGVSRATIYRAIARLEG